MNGASAAASVEGNCNDQFYGVYFGDSSATLNASTVSGINSNGGCQGQNAVDANTGWFQTETVTLQNVQVINNTVTGFGKNGITCDDVGLTCDVHGNTVTTNAMALGYAATNGIQFWGATGTVRSNTVDGDNYLPGSCLDQNYFSTGVDCSSRTGRGAS